MSGQQTAEWVRSLAQRTAALEALEFPDRLSVVTDNVSNPPTDAELDTAFGQPAALGEGYGGIVDDNGAGANVWLCYVAGTAWWYEALTRAV